MTGVRAVLVAAVLLVASPATAADGHHRHHDRRPCFAPSEVVQVRHRPGIDRAAVEHLAEVTGEGTPLPQPAPFQEGITYPACGHQRTGARVVVYYDRQTGAWTHVGRFAGQVSGIPPLP